MALQYSIRLTDISKYLKKFTFLSITNAIHLQKQIPSLNPKRCMKISKNSGTYEKYKHMKIKSRKKKIIQTQKKRTSLDSWIRTSPFWVSARNT